MSFRMQNSACCHRRALLSDLGMGFTGLTLGAMLAEDGIAAGPVRPRA